MDAVLLFLMVGSLVFAIGILCFVNGNRFGK